MLPLLSLSGASSTRRVGFVLKACMLATGCAGIVAEFVLSTLATYLIGNAIVQWTLVMSLMLFAMGLGSRLSRHFNRHLLDTFIMVEFSLSLLCALAAEVAYGLSAYTNYIALIIYGQAFVIGGLIGLEIPLVTRLNQAYEELRINISGVMEKDYYGALLGGLIFAFVALPYFGLTYTPIALGGVNFLVAAVLLFRFHSLVRRKRLLLGLAGLCAVLLVTLALVAEPVIQYGEQRKYRDKVIYAQQTPYQKIVLTQWKDYYWLFINGQEQFSTYDEEKYHEPLVHPAMQLAVNTADVLILGGGDGLALREILKYPAVRAVTLVDLDPAMTELAASHDVLRRINRDALHDAKVKVVNADAAEFLSRDNRLYSVIIVDLPDPDSVDLMHVYALDFYRQIKRHLVRGGVMVTQATSPYFSKKAFLCINKTMQAAGLATLPYHNQVPTMGEWGWVLGVDRQDITPARLKHAVLNLSFADLPTRFVNREAMTAMVHFGKGIFDSEVANTIRINTQHNPVLYRYYLDGSWGVY